MSIYENIATFAGLPVLNWQPRTSVPNPAGTAIRIGLDWDQAESGGTWPDLLFRFLDQPGSGSVRAFIVGPWGGSGEGVETALEALVAARTRLPDLTALFIGEMTSEENEISWIQQGDVTPVLSAFPRLERFRVRGGEGLRFGPNLRMEALRELGVETGGLDRTVIAQILAMDLPALERLDIWTGDDNYGANSSLEDLRPLLFGSLFPRLTALGICNSQYTDEAVEGLATSPLLPRLRELDLSLGTLSDRGAAVLLLNDAFRRLESLDLDHHYCSKWMTARLQAMGPHVSAEDRQKEDADDEGRRYVAVSE